MRFKAVIALALPLALVSGCHVNTNKSGNGHDNVDIGTPFGSMHVQTDSAAGDAQTGLTPYPGAVLVKKSSDDDDGAADISLNFGDFKLGVHAVDLRTSDPQDKVIAFYKGDMARYGDVLTCRGKVAVGTPVRTSHGLTCESGDKSDTNPNRLELRAGSEQHQHIVGIHTDRSGTRIGLVALDLPGALRHHDADDRE